MLLSAFPIFPYAGNLIKFWSNVDLTCNQTGTMCGLFDDEELHVRCVMMFKRELLESHYMAQGTD